MILAAASLAVSVCTLGVSVWVLRTARNSYLETHREYLAVVARAESDRGCGSEGSGE